VDPGLGKDHDVKVKYSIKEIAGRIEYLKYKSVYNSLRAGSTE